MRAQGKKPRLVAKAKIPSGGLKLGEIAGQEVELLVGVAKAKIPSGGHQRTGSPPRGYRIRRVVAKAKIPSGGLKRDPRESNQ